MTDSINVRADDRVKLIVGLATRENENDILRLWSAHSLVNGLSACTPRRERIAASIDSSDREVLVAYLPNGRLAAAVTVGVATSAEQLNRQLDHEVGIAQAELPAVTMIDGCSLPGGSSFQVLRIITLEVAARMRHHTAGMINSQVGVDSALEPHVLALLVKLGYVVFAVDDGVIHFHESCIPSRLTKGRIMTALNGLGSESTKGNIPSYEWQGPRLFARWMPSYQK